MSPLSVTPITIMKIHPLYTIEKMICKRRFIFPPFYYLANCFSFFHRKDLRIDIITLLILWQKWKTPHGKGLPLQPLYPTRKAKISLEIQLLQHLVHQGPEVWHLLIRILVRQTNTSFLIHFSCWQSEITHLHLTTKRRFVADWRLSIAISWLKRLV